MTYREEEAVIARAGAKCFYTNRRAARKCSNKVGVRFCARPCEHKVEPQYAIPVTDCAALSVGRLCGGEVVSNRGPFLWFTALLLRAPEAFWMPYPSALG
jgi:hypothetical protein